jgi:hypothetical protein
MHGFCWKSLLAVAAAVYALGNLAHAKEPLVTDRPDFTESSSSVGKGVLQLESGFTFADLENGTDLTAIGEILARWGIAERLELRFLLPTYARESGSGTSASGFLSTYVGLKYELAEGGGNGFIGGMEAALIAGTTVPTGTGDFESSNWEPVGVLSTSWELGSNAGIGTNIGLGRPAGDEQRFTTLWASVALGVGVTDDVSAFIELIGFNREEERGPNTLTFQTGLVYLFNPDLQLDARVARRLTDRGVDFLIGAGLSWRLGG